MKKYSAQPFVLVVFLVVSFFQITTLSANADLSPLTPPITPPLTSFLFTIKGKITLKKIHWRSLFSRFVPADNIRVKLENLQTHQMMMTSTNEDGVYIFKTNNKGLYKISPKFNHDIADIAAPPFRFVPLNRHDMLHEDFQLLDLP